MLTFISASNLVSHYDNISSMLESISEDIVNAQPTTVNPTVKKIFHVHAKDTASCKYLRPNSHMSKL